MRHQGSVSDLSHIEEIRTIARQDLGEGAVTPTHAADRPAVLRLLNEALATEIVCTLRYRRHYYTADGLLAQAARTEFLAHAQQEQQHADRIAERVAIESYRTMIRYLADAAPTTRRMLEDILAMEEAHAEDLEIMLHDVQQVVGSAGRAPPARG